MLDAVARNRIAEAARTVLDGGQITRRQALDLIALEEPADIFELLAWTNRVRERFHGRRIRLCSILNIKAGGCPEDCKFCAQASRYATETPRHGLLDAESILRAAAETRRYGVRGVALVAAWRGLEEGPLLDRLCEQFQLLERKGKVQPHASLGLIQNPRVARRLYEAGVRCYNHNLETSRRFFPSQCTTHTYEDRLRTLRCLKAAGIRVCSGGVLGLGETREDRIDLAFALRDLEADVVPINILNPIPGTPCENNPPLHPLEILKTVACFRLILPRQQILVAGGRAVNLRDAQSLVFAAGASALMVGNYLTTLNRPVEEDLQMLRDLGLEPDFGPPSPDREQAAVPRAAG